VVQKKRKPKKHQPLRTCVGCRQVIAKVELMRLVRGQNGISYDKTGKADGRGAYLHNKRNCWEKALKGSLAKALQTEMTEKDRNNLIQIMASLPEEENGG